MEQFSNLPSPVVSPSPLAVLRTKEAELSNQIRFLTTLNWPASLHWYHRPCFPFLVSREELCHGRSPVLLWNLSVILPRSSFLALLLLSLSLSTLPFPLDHLCPQTSLISCPEKKENTASLPHIVELSHVLRALPSKALQMHCLHSRDPFHSSSHCS